jgi:DNA-binding response OmpR family regulator
MRIPPPEMSGRTCNIELLAVSASSQDHETLGKILPAPEWTVQRARTVSSAMAQLRKHPRIPLVICERDLWPGTWQDMLLELRRLADPPLLIVASRFADEQLWAEALNVGAYDVLAKPFDPNEVSRTLRLAWSRWQSEHISAQREMIQFASGM